ncbi:hypothetical protein PRIPAC_96978 [Pristionchus pacificus]|uniref:Uncharacterized protein n=1 Tax=Pristionchus pacificus TaxID=54126 RepID=A0A2A6B3C2_PRIPA|nr:hypothetical protein PRIPAC_96978 [Pristionchus pacificus]|eukprot:PDM60372.1 hypothetical protein PRIPAC_54197 [Pristionchus pacificus]
MRLFFVISMWIALAGHNSFNYDFLTILKNVQVKNIALGRSIEAEAMNTRMANVNVKDDDMEAIFNYMVDGDTLVLTLRSEGAVTKQYFKRQLK